jgi:hypothetical protein
MDMLDWSLSGGIGSGCLAINLTNESKLYPSEANGEITRCGAWPGRSSFLWGALASLVVVKKVALQGPLL